MHACINTHTCTYTCTYTLRHHFSCRSETSLPTQCWSSQWVEAPLVLSSDITSRLILSYRRCPARKLKEKDELTEDKSAGTPCSERRLVRSFCQASTPSQSVRGLWGLFTWHSMIIWENKPFPPDLATSYDSITISRNVLHLSCWVRWLKQALEDEWEENFLSSGSYGEGKRNECFLEGVEF